MLNEVINVFGNAKVHIRPVFFHCPHRKQNHISVDVHTPGHIRSVIATRLSIKGFGLTFLTNLNPAIFFDPLMKILVPLCNKKTPSITLRGHFSMVATEGLEPSRSCDQQILSLSCIPISSCRRL